MNENLEDFTSMRKVLNFNVYYYQITIFILQKYIQDIVRVIKCKFRTVQEYYLEIAVQN